MSRKPKALSTRRNLAPLICCIGGILLNLLLGLAVSDLGLPIYLDTVGTVAAAVMGGYLPGVFVGFSTNVLKSISDPSSLYYGVLNVMIAVTAAWFAERRHLKNPHGILGLILILTLIGGGLGALIPWFMNGITIESGSLGGMLRSTGFFSKEAAHLISTLVLDLIDKAISVLLAFLICRIIPKKYRSLFSFTGWQQNPVTDGGVIRKGKSHVRSFSLRIKMLIVLILSLSTVAVAGTFISVKLYYKMIIDEHTQVAQGTAALAARELDGDKINGYIADNGNSEDYLETKQLLADILVSSKKIAYLYVYKMDWDGFHVVFDIETANEPADPIGSVIPYDEGFAPYLQQLLAGEAVEPIITDDEYGYLLTAAEPVYDSNGKCQCYAIADVDVEMLIKNERSFLTGMITVFLSFLIMICAVVIWLTDYHIIFPIRSITAQVNRLSHSGDSQDRSDQDVKKMRSLDIHTGDEIEQLYHSICGMTLNQAEQMRSIRRLSDSTAKMQDGLIITMADMVENRDSDTGAHIQKTAAYVRIIVEGLKRKGYYAEKITPKFMSDVVRSAPLHDVGKINIPDEVLNKPGKLTASEYEIMKTHTTAGKKIIEHAIITVEGDSYLKEARNMAAYHHERWDGKGYPEKLHGEVIPLSARIMSVADVFDALTSPRVYKPAFSIEKALAVIEEGKGSQFDPKCVEAFMDSLPEVKEILRKYNREA